MFTATLQLINFFATVLVGRGRADFLVIVLTRVGFFSQVSGDVNGLPDVVRAVQTDVLRFLRLQVEIHFVEGLEPFGQVPHIVRVLSC